MEEKLITFETAKLAKEKGFDWFVKDYFGQINTGPFELHKDSPTNFNSTYWAEEGGEWISAPTQALLQKWLREIHFLDIEPEKYRHDQTGRYYKLRIWGSEMSNEGYLTGFNSYEEALGEGLQAALNLI